MTTRVELRLASGDEPAGEQRAWLIPGDTAAAWLAELCTFAVDLREVVLLPVPASRTRREPVGVVAVLPPGVVPAGHHRAEPWQCRAGCVLLPAVARLAPPVRDDELRALVPGTFLVLHPAIGPIAYAAADVRAAADLLAVVQRSERWDAAVPGVTAVAGLVAVEPLARPTFDQLFGDARDAIGSASPRDIPALPGEPGEPGAPFAVGVAGWLARFVLWATRRVPRTANAPTWIDRLEAWARRQQRPAPPRADQRRRRREIERLLRLLRDDPARGLRHALPLGGPPGRGVAPPGNRLGARDPQYDARRLAGGGRTDTWDVDPATQVELLTRYREIANQEIAAGRHRRAAYVFAHLLGDLPSAARTLRDGGHHREAAELFRDRLGNAAEAARCLVAGGLLAEAADLHASLGEFEAVGDLRLLLGQHELATDAYQRAHVALQLRGDVVAAALLRAEKLREPDEAVHELELRWRRQWHEHAFAAWLGLATRLHGDERVGATLLAHGHDDGPGGVEPAIGMATVLAAFVARRDGSALRDLARDQVRRAVAHSQGHHGPAARRRLLVALQAVSPHDPVLMHDVRRGLPAVAAPPRPAGGKSPPLRRSWQCLVEIPEQHAVACCDQWLLHLDGTGCALRRRAFAATGEVDQHFMAAPRAVGSPALLATSSNRCVLMVRKETPGQWRVEWLDVASWPPSHTFVGVLDGDFVVADDERVVWTVTATDGGVIDVRRHSTHGHLLTTETRPALGALDCAAPLATVVAGHLVLLYGAVLIVRPPQGAWMRLELPARGGSLVRSPEPDHTVVLIGLARGFVAVDVLKAADAQTPAVLGDELVAPTLGWTRAGLAVAVDAQHAQVWRCGVGGMRREHEQPLRSGQPRLILPTAAVDEVVFVAAQTMTCFQIR